MSNDTTLSRTLHDVGLAAWFGGSLMGAVGLNGAAASIGGRDGVRVQDVGWTRWQPVTLAALAAHGIGSIGLTRANRGRLRSQQGVASLATAKAVVTLAAVGASVYAAYLGRRVGEEHSEPVAAPEDAPAEAFGNGSGPQVSGARRQLGLVQWAVPALTGAALVLNARMSEQQRTANVVRGVVHRAGGGLSGRVGDARPDRIGDVVPDRLADMLPDRLGDMLPDRLGDMLPDRLGDMLPDRLTDVLPERVASRL